MKPYYLLSTLLLLGLTSCQDDVIENNHKAEFLGRFQEQSTSEIINNYLTNTLSLTRSNGNYTIEPIISGNDTIMYLANYGGEGWTLFSNDKRAKMVLMSSEEGYLSANDIKDKNSPISDYIARIEESLALLAKDDSKYQTDPSWELFSKSNLVPFEPDTIGPFPGHLNIRYELTSPLTITYDTIKTGHLCLTKWGQSSPWNRYIPLIDNVHCLTGCAAIATAQFLYFQHYRIGEPQLAPSSGYYNATYNYYTFSNYSTSIWDSMALNRNESNTEKAALFIGSIAKEIVDPYNFGTIGTATYTGDMIDYISSLGLNLVQLNYNDSCAERIKETLVAGNILLANGFRTKHEEDGYETIVGHSFLIDGLIELRTHTSGIYAVYEEIISDITGETLSSNFQRLQQIEKTNTNYYYLMNWGWDGSCDDTWCSCNINEGWKPNNNRDYNLFREVYVLQSNQ